MFDFTLPATDGAARAGVFTTPHGELATPLFMPVGTQGAVKGVSPDELHARARAQVDGRNGDHAVASSRKARRKATPAADDFSGWNWTPTDRPTRTAAGKRSPSCVLYAVTTDGSTGRQTKELA